MFGVHLFDPSDGLRASMIAALQTDDDGIVGYLGFDADIHLAFFARHEIGQLSRLCNSGFARDVLLDEEDHGLEGISSPRHEAIIWLT